MRGILFHNYTFTIQPFWGDTKSNESISLDKIISDRWKIRTKQKNAEGKIWLRKTEAFFPISTNWTNIRI